MSVDMRVSNSCAVCGVALCNELGLAEFVAGLISETFEAISASMEDQVRRHSDLAIAADISISDDG